MKRRYIIAFLVIFSLAIYFSYDLERMILPKEKITIKDADSIKMIEDIEVVIENTVIDKINSIDPTYLPIEMKLSRSYIYTSSYGYFIKEGADGETKLHRASPNLDIESFELAEEVDLKDSDITMFNLNDGRIYISAAKEGINNIYYFDENSKTFNEFIIGVHDYKITYEEDYIYYLNITEDKSAVHRRRLIDKADQKVLEFPKDSSLDILNIVSNVLVYRQDNDLYRFNVVKNEMKKLYQYENVIQVFNDEYLRYNKSKLNYEFVSYDNKINYSIESDINPNIEFKTVELKSYILVVDREKTTVFSKKTKLKLAEIYSMVNSNIIDYGFEIYEIDKRIFIRDLKTLAFLELDIVNLKVHYYNYNLKEYVKLQSSIYYVNEASVKLEKLSFDEPITTLTSLNEQTLELYKYLNMKKEDIMTELGPVQLEYVSKIDDNENAIKFANGLAFIFNEEDEVLWIEPDSTYKIGSAKVGFNFTDIQKELGNTDTENFEIKDDNDKVTSSGFKIEYEYNGVGIEFRVKEETSRDTNCMIYKTR